MKLMNEMHVSFPSSSANEGFARAAVAAFVAQLDPTVDELCDIRTAVSEAVTNCIVHAYRDTIGTISVTCKIFENGCVVVRVRDRGCGIADIKQAMQPMFTTQEGERAGLGFAVMQNFMDRLHVSSRLGKGTSVTLQKTIRSRQDNGK